jgi:hypothetical protein
MFSEDEIIPQFRTTFINVMDNLSELKDIKYEDFANTVEDDCFNGYHFEGEDEVIGMDNWVDFSKDGDYQLNVKVNHPDAYNFTLDVTTKDNKVTVTNVL